MRCECGRKPVNDAGICESCHYHRQGVTVDAGSSMKGLVMDLILHRDMFGDKSLVEEMGRIYDEFNWTKKMRQS